MKVVKLILQAIFKIIGMLFSVFLALLVIPLVVILFVGLSNLIFDGWGEFLDYMNYQKDFFIAFGVVAGIAVVCDLLGGPEKKKKTSGTSTYPRVSSSGWSSGSSESYYELEPSFDAGSYVEKHCTGYIYGLVTETDLSTIENDTSLTYEEKEAARSALEHKATIYY